MLAGMVSHLSRMLSYHNRLVLYKDTLSVFLCQFEELILSISKFLISLFLIICLALYLMVISAMTF